MREKMKISKEEIQEAKQKTEAFQKHILDCLVAFQYEEEKIINKTPQIWGNHNLRPHLYFHRRKNFLMDLFKCKITKESFEIESMEDDFVRVKFFKSTKLDSFIIIKIPYDFSEIKHYAKNLFSDMMEEINLAISFIEEIKKEEDEVKEWEKQIRQTCCYGEYEYRWKECNSCDWRGKIEIPTGETKAVPRVFFTHDSDSYFEEVPVMMEENCPECKGKKGLVVFTDRKGYEREFPCSKYEFSDNKNNFLNLLIKNTNIKG